MSNTNIKLFLVGMLAAMVQALLQSDGTQGKAYNPPPWPPLHLQITIDFLISSSDRAGS
jgi:hypothetical protein